MKVRCSQIGLIMTGQYGLTPSQQKKLDTLEAKQASGKPLTKLQAIDYGKLLDKQANPKLSATVQDAVMQIWINNELNRYQELDSKYLKKGTEAEEASIDLFTEVSGSYHLKNEDRMTNDYISGECDLVGNDSIADIKTSWDIFTFAKCEMTKANYWQLQGYLELWDKTKGQVVYCLTDTPEQILEREFRRMDWNGASDQAKGTFAMTQIFTEQYFEEIKMTYFPDFDGNFIEIPKEQRVKIFEVERSTDEYQLLCNRIDVCRDFYNQIKL